MVEQMDRSEIDNYTVDTEYSGGSLDIQGVLKD